MNFKNTFLVGQLSTWKWHYYTVSVKSVRLRRMCKQSMSNIFEMSHIVVFPRWLPLNYMTLKVNGGHLENATTRESSQKNVAYAFINLAQCVTVNIL